MVINDTLEKVVDNRGKTPPTTTDGHFLLEINCIAGAKKYPDYTQIRKFVSEDTYNTWFRSGHPQKGDILIPTVGTLDAIAIMDRNDCCIAQNMIAFRTDPSICDSEYLYYYLCNPIVRKRVLNLDIGGVQPSIKVPHIKKLEIDIPKIDEQRKIALVLGAIDDKIQLNYQINDNLQEQAKAIYQHIVVENADASWTSGVLSDIAVITMGQSPKGESYNEEGIGTVFFQGRAEFGFRFPTRRLFTTDPKRMALANDALMSVRAPVGDMNVAYEDCCIGRGLGSIRSKDGHQSFVFYTMLALREQLNVFNGEGTVFGSINRDALNTMPVDIPPKEIMDQFEDLVAPVDASIRNNYDEICRLQTMRDSLLPKLMSGEIDVSAITL